MPLSLGIGAYFLRIPLGMLLSRHSERENALEVKFSGQQYLEINPRYTYKNFSIWASARYNSKKYANVGNSIYFNGYWETFAGASWKAFKNVTFTANLVNFLNETGPSGNVPGSALITDGSQYAGTLIAGTYIRPFQAQFGMKINF